MIKITAWIKDNGLSQHDAAGIFGIQRTRVSDLMRGKIQKFTSNSDKAAMPQFPILYPNWETPALRDGI
ncbi:MAG: hypothetical protein F4147_04475 [Gammaproteobacteria bacterium]|nr:hypothetical protein [Gammaproteobacteria bacterium]